MSERIRPVTFTNRDGLRLVGMLHEPATGGRRDVAIVLLSPGVKTRVAPHRLYNKMASALAAQGFTVLRFDFYGLGDAEGEVPLRQLRDLYGSVALGRYVGDTRDALDWLAKTHGFSRFIVGGLCGGALTGLLTAPKDPRVAGIVALGLPVMLDSADLDPRQFMTVGQLTNLRSRYLQKALDPKAWLRVLSLKTDFRLMLKSFGTLFKQKQPRPAAPAPAAAGAAPAGSGPATPAAAIPANMNPHFAPAFFTTAEQGRPMLVLFSEADRLYWEFDEKFVAPNRQRFDACAAQVDLHVIKSANHVLTFEPWQAEMQAHLRHWLDTRFAARA
jgi:alpha-beta hydrolase superfamily lysophospholipase